MLLAPKKTNNPRMHTYRQASIIHWANFIQVSFDGGGGGGGLGKNGNICVILPQPCIFSLKISCQMHRNLSRGKKNPPRNPKLRHVRKTAASKCSSARLCRLPWYRGKYIHLCFRHAASQEIVSLTLLLLPLDIPCSVLFKCIPFNSDSSLDHIRSVSSLKKTQSNE